jgi:hypothetical protein
MERETQKKSMTDKFKEQKAMQMFEENRVKQEIESLMLEPSSEPKKTEKKRVKSKK